MSTAVWYIATEMFDPQCGEAWDDYVKWSGLTQLREVVSLDGMICSYVLPTLKDERHWDHIVNEDYLLDLFTNLEFMLSELEKLDRINVLAVIQDPADIDHRKAAPLGFSFLGFDLMDKELSNSALTNCGGFPDVFANDELNTVGLLDDYRRAREIRDALRLNHPEERHADCNIWAIYRRQDQ